MDLFLFSNETTLLEGVFSKLQRQSKLILVAIRHMFQLSFQRHIRKYFNLFQLVLLRVE